MSKIVSRKATRSRDAKSASSKATMSHVSKDVRNTARSVIVKYRKALKDLEKY